MFRILVTGGTGFVGSFVAPRLAALGHEVVLAGRTAPPGIPRLPFIRIGEQGPDTDWRAALAGVDVVLHLAGKAHAPGNSPGVREEIHRVNVLGTEALARQAAGVVRRIVYLSSIKVYGEESGDEPFGPDSPLLPQDSYGVSKARAEDSLREAASRTGLEAVIVRPPLLIGPGLKGNLASLLRAINLGIPLPLANVQNKRSILSLDNLADLLATTLDHPRAAGGPLLAADELAISTPQLIRWLAEASGRSARLFSVPGGLLATTLKWGLGEGQARRLLKSAYLDTTRTRDALAWRPRLGTQAALCSYLPIRNVS